MATPGLKPSSGTAPIGTPLPDPAIGTIGAATGTGAGGRMTEANIAFDDHPDALRYGNRIRTVSVDSIIHFVEGRGEGWRIEEIAGAQPRRY